MWCASGERDLPLFCLGSVVEPGSARRRLIKKIDQKSKAAYYSIDQKVKRKKGKIRVD